MLSIPSPGTALYYNTLSSLIFSKELQLSVVAIPKLDLGLIYIDFPGYRFITLVAPISPKTDYFGERVAITSLENYQPRKIVSLEPLDTDP